MSAALRHAQADRAVEIDIRLLLRVNSIAHKTSGSVAISSESYVYDGAGDMSSKMVDGLTTTVPSGTTADSCPVDARTNHTAQAWAPAAMLAALAPIAVNSRVHC